MMQGLGLNRDARVREAAGRGSHTPAWGVRALRVPPIEIVLYSGYPLGPLRTDSRRAKRLPRGTHVPTQGIQYQQGGFQSAEVDIPNEARFSASSIYDSDIALGSMPGGIRPHIIRMRRPGRPMKKHVVHSQTKILDTTSANVWSRL